MLTRRSGGTEFVCAPVMRRPPATKQAEDSIGFVDQLISPVDNRQPKLPVWRAFALPPGRPLGGARAAGVAARMLLAFCSATDRSSSSSSPSRSRAAPCVSPRARCPGHGPGSWRKRSRGWWKCRPLNGENPQSSVVPSARLVCSRRLRAPGRGLLRGPMRGSAGAVTPDEDPLIGFPVLRMILRTCRRSRSPRARCRSSGLQLEQAGQQLCVVHVRRCASHRNRSQGSVHPMRPALFRREPGEREMLRSMKLLRDARTDRSSPPPPFGESTGLVRAFFKQRGSRSRARSPVLMNCSRDSRNLLGGLHQAQTGRQSRPA